MDRFAHCEIGYGYATFLFVFIDLNLFSSAAFLLTAEFG